MKRVTALLLLLLTARPLYAQTSRAQMDTLIAAYVREHQFNGAVLVAHRGQVIYKRGVGYRDATRKLPNEANTLFQIGSITKSFTAAIIMQLQEEGRLSVTDTLGKYFPRFVNGDKITLAHLLTHTSGIHNYTNDTLMLGAPGKPHTQAEIIAAFSRFPSDFAPGSRFNYSNSGYSMLGYLIEKVTGKPYEQVVRERILVPLGMRHSGFDPAGQLPQGAAMPYVRTGTGAAQPAPDMDYRVAFAAGAMYATVEDLCRWDRAIAGGRVLQPASWKTVFTPNQRKYGYGWTIDSTHGRLTVGHGGSISGFTSCLLRFPDEELTVILLDNMSDNSLSRMARGLAAIVLGAPYELPGPRTEIRVAPEVLQQYEGDYQLSSAARLTVRLREGKLFAQLPQQEAFELFAERKDRFFLKVSEASVTFMRGPDGEVTELLLQQNGRSARARKVAP